MAVSYLLTPDQRRLRNRDAALTDAISLTVSEMGLPANAEDQMWADVRRVIDSVLDMADAAVAARVEFEAVDRRLDRHVKKLHHLCPCNRTCPDYHALDQRRGLLQRRADRAMRSLLGGGR